MEYFNYLVQFLLGGILFTLLYHFSKEKNTMISSIITAFPTLFLAGFMYLLYFDANIIHYVQNCVYTFSLDVVFFITILILYSLFPKSIGLYFGLAFCIYIFIVFFI